MNMEQLLNWEMKINLKLARLQRPNATYLASAYGWGCFERLVDLFDCHPVELLEIRVTRTLPYEVVVKTRKVYDLRDTSSGDETLDFTQPDQVIAFAATQGLQVYLRRADLVIFDSP
jgi:hypothetical protein